MDGVALRLRPDELGELVAKQLATAGAIALGRRRHQSWVEAWPSPSCAPDTRLSGGRGRRRSARWRVRLRDRSGRVRDVDLIWEQVVVDAHDPVALGRCGPRPWAGFSWAMPRTRSRSGRLRIGCRAGCSCRFRRRRQERTDSILTSVRSIKPQKSNVSFPSVLGGPMSGSVTRRGWYSPTLKAMSSASFVDGFGPIPRSRRHRTTLLSSYERSLSGASASRREAFLDPER
jgi:hypothetical protein